MTSLHERVQQALHEHHVLTLATHDGHSPWAAAVFYAHEGLDFYFLSKRDSRHALAIAKAPRCAITIQRDYDDWPTIVGIQAEGEVVTLDGEARGHARAVYAAKFPFVDRFGGAPAAIAQALDLVHWYRFRPQQMFLIDNSRGFGHREEVGC
jgi:uncharacterized protein YhbP (UPF0306 family)